MAICKSKRRQLRNGYKHLGKIGRPVWKKKAPETMAKRLAKTLAKARTMQGRRSKRHVS